MEHQIEDMRAQALCKAFALNLNGLVRPGQSIDFIVTACLLTKADAAAAHWEAVCHLNTTSLGTVSSTTITPYT